MPRRKSKREIEAKRKADIVAEIKRKDDAAAAAAGQRKLDDAAIELARRAKVIRDEHERVTKAAAVLAEANKPGWFRRNFG